METVRDILAAHRSGISRPGILAWARLRIDPAMTEAQLEEELARLGDEVVDLEGFLYLREYVDPSRLPARAGVASRAASGAPPAGSEWTWSRSSSPRGRDDEPGLRSPPPATAGGAGGCAGRGWRIIGVGAFLWWLISIIGGLVEGGVEPLPSPQPTPVATVAPGSGTPTPALSIAPTPATGDIIGWPEIAVGDCIVVPSQDFYEVRRVPCDTPHGGEVIAVLAHPGTAYPDDGFASFADAACGPAFRDWTGGALDEQELLDLQWFTPTSEGWADGDRTVICFLGHADGSDAERSYRSGT